jgi:Ca2+-binding EF-hand superfamily protein
MKTFLCSLALLAVSVPPAVALRDGSRLMALVDADGDGAVSQAEMAALRDRAFGQVDADGDGAIDPGELVAARAAVEDRSTMAQARMRIVFRRLDQDGDGRVTRDEVARRAVMFETADRDGDGLLTANELQALRDLATQHRN